LSRSYRPPRSSARWYAGRAWIVSRKRAIAGYRLPPPRAVAASSGKLIWMSAALKPSPTNQPLRASAPSTWPRCRSICGSTKPDCSVAAILRAIGRAKNGIGACAIRSATSLSSSGGIADPSA